MGGVLYYYYDKYVTTPIENEKKKTKICKETLKETSDIYEDALQDAGVSISYMLQRVQNANDDLLKERELRAIEVQECGTKLKSIKWRKKLEKKKNDKYFYTYYPIK